MGIEPPYFTMELDSETLPVRVFVTGEIVAATADEMTLRLGEAHAFGGGVTLDLGGVTFIDSSGLRVIARELQRSKDSQQTFTISAASDRVRRIFTMTGLDTLLPPADPVEH